MCFWSIAALLVVEEHHVANANVEELGEQFQDARRLHLLVASNEEIGQVLLVEPMAGSHLQEPKGETL